MLRPPLTLGTPRETATAPHTRAGALRNPPSRRRPTQSVTSDVAAPAAQLSTASGRKSSPGSSSPTAPTPPMMAHPATTPTVTRTATATVRRHKTSREGRSRAPRTWSPPSPGADQVDDHGDRRPLPEPERHAKPERGRRPWSQVLSLPRPPPANPYSVPRPLLQQRPSRLHGLPPRLYGRLELHSTVISFHRDLEPRALQHPHAIGTQLQRERDGDPPRSVVSRLDSRWYVGREVEVDHLWVGLQDQL